MKRTQLFKIPPEQIKALRLHYPAEYTAWVNFRAKARRSDYEYDEAFDEFAVFLEYVGPRPDANYSLDRIDNANRRYERGNLAWRTKTQQSNNRDSTIYLTYDGPNAEYSGLTKPLTDWARLTDQNPATMHGRKRRGWTDSELVDGKRDRPTKSFSQMSEEQLLRYKPWPEDTSAQDEKAYLKHGEDRETRFEFERRYLIPREQRRIDRSAPQSMVRLGNIPKGEEDHWDEEEIDRKGDWVLTDERDRSTFEKVVKDQRHLNSYKKTFRKTELQWLAAMKRYRLAKVEQKAVAGMRARLLSSRSRDRYPDDGEIDWEPFI